MVASQGKAAARTAEEAVRPQPQRYRVNVPHADEAVNAWMAAQYNHSLSVRILIRESIERHGYIDVMNRPVDQLPKRGRPVVTEDETPTEPAVPRVQPQQPAAPVLPAASTDLDFSQDPPAAPELLGIALESPVMAPGLQAPVAEPVSPVIPVPAPSNPEASAGGQVDVNDIFSSIR